MGAITGPGIEDRTIVIGRTGSGKTQFSCDLLSTRNWDQMPWIVIDYKREKLIAEIGKALGPKWFHDMRSTDPVPKRPGIYAVRAMPHEDADVEALMFRIWERGRVGFYVDEGFMLPQALPRYKGFNAILTQGRSLEIPTIALYQRASWMNMNAKAQADFFAVFALNSKTDAQTIMDYIKPAVVSGRVITPTDGLPKYNCLWYEVSEDRSTVLRPARSKPEIIQAFRDRIAVPERRNRAGVI